MRIREKIDNVFAAAHLAGLRRRREFSLDSEWRSEVMAEVRRAAVVQSADRRGEVNMGAFALRLGWTMMLVAVMASLGLYAVGVDIRGGTDSMESVSLWESVEEYSDVKYDSILDEIYASSKED